MTASIDKAKAEASIVNVTTDREAYPKRWIAALVQMCTEKKVGDKLRKLNVENFVPTQVEIRQWSDRKKKIERVAIPMVVFIYTDQKQEKQLKNYSFIHKILSYPGDKETAIIPDYEIERLKFMLRNADSQVEIIDRIFEIGQTIRITKGPLKGLEGELCNLNSEKPMVAVRIESLGYACVNVSKKDIESL